MGEQPEYPVMSRPPLLLILAIILIVALVLIAGYSTSLWPGTGAGESVYPTGAPAVSPVPGTSLAPNPPPVTVVPTALPLPVLTPVSDPEQGCINDSDCVPAQCCHPTSCINRAYKHVCTLLCTDVCLGPIDCGAGSCACINGDCSVRNSTGLPFPTENPPYDGE